MIPIYKAYIYTIISAVSLFDDEDQPKKSSSETKRREESGGGEYIDEFMYLIILFGLWMIYAISGEWKWLSNKVVKYLSGISMEIYLSHMVLFRLTEKMGLDQITGNSDLNYIMATVVTLAMTIGFCHVVKYKFLPKVMGCIKNKKINENCIC